MKVHIGKLTAGSPKNPIQFEKENHVNQISISLGSMLVFQGVGPGYIFPMKILSDSPGPVAFV